MLKIYWTNMVVVILDKIHDKVVIHDIRERNCYALLSLKKILSYYILNANGLGRSCRGYPKRLEHFSFVFTGTPPAGSAWIFPPESIIKMIYNSNLLVFYALLFAIIKLSVYRRKISFDYVTEPISLDDYTCFTSAARFLNF